MSKAIERPFHRRPEECSYWGVHSGPALDLLVVRGNERRGFEGKFADAPEVTRSLISTRETLGLDRVDVVYPGPETFVLRDGFRAVSIARLAQDVAGLRGA